MQPEISKKLNLTNMSKIGELLITTLAPALQVVATEKLDQLFDKMAAKDVEGHAAALKSLYIGADQLQRLTDTTKTKIDDAIVDALVTAIEDSAEKHGVELPDVDEDLNEDEN